MSKPRAALLPVLVGLSALLLAAGPASAAVILSEHYSGTDAFSYDCDGVTVDVEAEFAGVAHFRVGTGPDDSAFFLHDNYEFREVHTSANGEVLIVSGNGVFQETRATRVTGSIFEFNSVNAGQPFIVTDADGNVLVRDRGVIRETILFDTLGDDVPGGELIEFVDFAVGGPHPGLLFDTCSLLG